MINNIHPCIWYDGNAKDAATFYCSIFSNSKITVDTPMVVNFELAGQKFMGLNGGPMFKTNASISFMVICDDNAEIDKLWKYLSDGGFVMMPLDKYPWSEYFGYVQDKFGLSWQLIKAKPNTKNQKIVPTFLFVGNSYGKAQDAIKLYAQIFPSSSIDNISFYTKDEGEHLADKIKFSQFTLDEKIFTAMDGYGNHKFAFNEAISFVVECNNQQEIDFYWDKLIANGGNESNCGWLKDKFGVSWQIVPKILGQLMSNTQKSQKVMQAFMQMKKFDIAALQKAAE